MKLENRKEEIIPFSKFILRLGSYGFYAFILVAFSVLLGIMGYHFIAGLSWLDSFHMASMILTGMGPVMEMTSPSAKIFSSVYALYSGVAFLSIIAVFFAPIIHRLLHILHVDEHDENKK